MELQTIDPIEQYIRKQRHIYIYTDIDDALALDVTQRLAFYDSQSTKKEITIFINSGGGELAAAFAIIDAIELCSSPVRTVGRGLVGSAALMIFMVADLRQLDDRCSCLSHRLSAFEVGDHADLNAAHIEIERLHDRGIELYKKYTALNSKEEVEKHLLKESDYYLSPQEALRFCICDEIIKTSMKHTPIKRSASLRRWLGAKKAGKQRSQKSKK